MRHFSRTTLLLLVGCCCVVAISAFAIQENKKEGENSGFEFDEFAGESSAASSDSASSEESGELEANVEMLPANFENVEPPGVDHMELTSDVVPVKMMREYQGAMVEV